jgi:hypothetical protein
MEQERSAWAQKIDLVLCIQSMRVLIRMLKLRILRPCSKHGLTTAPEDNQQQLCLVKLLPEQSMYLAARLVALGWVSSKEAASSILT